MIFWEIENTESMSFSLELPSELQLLTNSRFGSVTLTCFLCDSVSQFPASYSLLKLRMESKGNRHASVHMRRSMAVLVLKALAELGKCSSHFPLRVPLYYKDSISIV